MKPESKTMNTTTTDYAKMLTQIQPKPIQTKAEKDEFLKQVDWLMSIDENELTQEQADMLELLAIIIEDFDRKNYQLPEKATPNDIVIELMQSHYLKQKDLIDIFGSKGIVSEVINKKRSISKSQAKALGARFKVSPALFI